MTVAGGAPGTGDGGGASAQLKGVFESSTSKMSAIGYVGMPRGHSCHSSIRHSSMCHVSQPDSPVSHHPLRSGSLLASLGKQVRTVTDISKGLVEDLAGLVEEKPDGVRCRAQRPCNGLE